LQIIVGLTAEALQADFCEVRFLDDKAQQLVLGAIWGGGERAQRSARLGIAGSLGGVVALEEAAVHIPDLCQDPRTEHLSIVDHEGLRTYLGVPLLLKDKVIGVLSLARRQLRPFSEEEIELLISFAHQAAVAIEEANLQSETQRAQQRSQAIIQNSADGILLINANRRVVGFNPALERLTGWRAEEVYGVPCQEVLQAQCQGEDYCQDSCPILELSGQEPHFAECQIRTRDGRLIDVGISYGVIYSDRGRLEGVVEVIRDISQQKELDRLRSDFVSTVSHELRTPLALIKGYAATLLRPDIELESGTQQRFIWQIDAATDRLTRLIDNLLSVSRIEAGRLGVLLEPLDLDRLVSKVMSDMQPAAAGHRLVSRVIAAHPVALADPDKVEQVLLNLVHNAIKFSPPASTITLSVEDGQSDTETGQEFLLVGVQDRGRGVPPEHRDRIFEKFYQVETGLTRSVSGTGLGLYICKNLVEAHGGRIWVEAAAEGGSVFCFTLPRA
jgi:PAS domain S-box-containing protein